MLDLHDMKATVNVDLVIACRISQSPDLPVRLNKDRLHE